MENRNSFSEMNYVFFVLNKAALRIKRVKGGVARQKLRPAISFLFRKSFTVIKAIELEEELDQDEFFEEADVYEPIPEPNDLVLF